MPTFSPQRHFLCTTAPSFLLLSFFSFTGMCRRFFYYLHLFSGGFLHFLEFRLNQSVGFILSFIYYIHLKGLCITEYIETMSQ